MTENKKITRRDAIKLLGAVAGATALANVPSKWKTPSIARGVLPAHAQTSACYAVFVEILTSVGGDFGISGIPNPEGGSGDGTAGSTAFWNCQTGCLLFSLFLNTAISGSIQVTTLTSSFVLNFDAAGTASHDILIDMGTGAYALNGIGNAGSCSWPQIGFAPSASAQRSNFWGNK